MLPDDRFSGTFSRTVSGPATLTFNYVGDDGVRFKLDGVTQLDDWGRNTYGAATPFALTLPAGQHILRIEYQELDGLAGLYLTSPDFPFMTTNQAISGASNGFGGFGSWNADTWAASGNFDSYNGNTMNLGMVDPTRIVADNNRLYIADTYRPLVKVHRNGNIQSVYNGVVGPEAMTLAGSNAMWWAQNCDVRLLNLNTTADVSFGGSCGTGVSPGTYNNANLRFEGVIRDMAFDNLARLYILDDKYVWRSNAPYTQFTAVIGTEFNSGSSANGTLGSAFFLDAPLSLAVSGNTLMVGEQSRLLRFDYDPLDDQYGTQVLIQNIPSPAVAEQALPAAQTTVNGVTAVEFVNGSEVVFAEFSRHTVRHINLGTNIVSPVVGTSYQHAPHYNDATNSPVTANANFLMGYPTDIALADNGIYVTQQRSATVVRLR